MAITLNGTTGITTPAETATTSVTTPLLTSPAATALTIQSAGTTAMTVGTNQNIGVGGAVTSDTTYKWLTITGPTTSGGGILQLNNSDSSVGINMFCNNLAGYVGTSTAHPLLFRTNSSEAARIDTSGNLLVGTTNVNGKVNSKTTTTSLPAFFANTPSGFTTAAYQSESITAASTGWYHFYGTSSTGTVANIAIFGNGNVQNANNSYGALSDESLKENINDATPKLDDLLKVQVRNYNLKNDPDKTKQIGVVAQELELIFPAMVEADSGGIKGVKYSVFVPMLIKCIQELSAKNDALEARLAAVEAK